MAETGSEDKVILGIDPGTHIMGYGILHVRNKHPELVHLDVLKLSANLTHPDRLKKIFESTLALIDEYLPDELAIEAPFFGKNVQSMLKLGRAQGVAMAACLHRSIPIFEYSPKKIKQSITGNGNASKEQVAAMLQSILKIRKMPGNLDATDGLAAALCHHYQRTHTRGADGGVSGWSAFLKKNPGRIRKS
ncbi:MAG: crossover junction endodeoxyribonuclease RuvC [Flavobacteriales bacterium]|nr:crossover junction endodeoxyribonuclease RuvC [Flavobacteriales bacterium]MCB9448426.1 crossover junction endodeoxyribonuclease RuvC [Flavobacteriales bacterium]